MENHIGQNIKRIAEIKNLTAQELAYRWKKSPQAVYDLYNKQFPKADAIIEMSKILKASVLDILGIKDEFEKTLQENTDRQDLFDELRKQLKVKDEQILFLQNLIEKLNQG